jgi:ABC-type glycerol-3-phosphate transport system substrate-binding protein/DNA-binding transcriptional regulator YhcF (GntR family)
MKDKIQIVREYILDSLETGKLHEGDKLPGARVIARKLNISFLIVQNAISTLVRDNILCTLSRKGTFIREDWNQQILNGNVITNYTHYKWFKRFKKSVGDLCPELRFSHAFNRGMFEIKTTLHSQVDQKEFMDLSRVYHEVCGDQSKYYTKAVEPFSINGKMVGIPFTFSPRVMFFNKNILKEAGLKEPESDWSWDDFLHYIKCLKKLIPPSNIFDWNDGMNVWMNIVLRCGGQMIDPWDDDPVKIDSVETRRGLKLWKELRNILEIKPGKRKSIDWNTPDLFIKGQKTFFIGSRVNTMFFREKEFNDWGVVPLPVIVNEVNLCTQATEVICVRRECPYDMAKLFTQTMLSKPIQNFMGKIPYQIPFLISAAKKSIDENDPRDKLFIKEFSHAYGKYFIGYPEFFNIINAGMSYLWKSEDNVDTVTAEIAATLRTLLKIRLVPHLKNQE